MGSILLFILGTSWGGGGWEGRQLIFLASACSFHRIIEGILEVMSNQTLRCTDDETVIH